MPENGEINVDATLAAWADIVIKMWKGKMAELGVYDKGNLYESLLYELTRNAGNSIDKIEFVFKLYGKFVDMGVGGEMSVGNSGKLDGNTERKPKPWLSKIFFGQLMRLREILIEKYAQQAEEVLRQGFTGAFDQRYNSVLEARTVGSMRSIQYRGATNARSAKNYQKRRAKSGKWTNDHKTWKPD